MITKDDIIEVGYVSKTHGLSGNLEVVITEDWLDELGVDFIFIEIDGCYIPFRITEERTKNSGRLLKLDNIDTKEEAEHLIGATVFLSTDDVDEESLAEAETVDYEGYTIYDADGSKVGVIDYVDYDTENVLFCLDATDSAGFQIMIPAVDDFIIEIDDDKQTIIMDIPEGLLDLNGSGVCVDDEDD
ncbi:MAG: ribosome maturation factor RimM [Paludibacteraceae bacterium]|nr:ribosome maturation factor RimM [Paludibacteraceae bacterium]